MKRVRLSSKKKEELLGQLCRRGRKCHYCGIREEEFPGIWEIRQKGFYGFDKKRQPKRGRKLEVDRKDETQGYDMTNCVPACALCNMAKSNMFHYKEFRLVGNVIREIWQERKLRVSHG